MSTAEGPLQALDRYYDRMEKRHTVPEYGFTVENISYAVSLSGDGSIRAVTDLRHLNAKGKPKPARMIVPRPKRTSDVTSNFLWDKTAYAFGVDSGKSKRLAREHAEFKRFHREMLAGIDDKHVKAFLAFLERWNPGRFSEPPFSDEMLDASFIFRLEDEHQFLHELPILRQKWVASLDDPNAPQGVCLISGVYGKIETGHPIIKNVDGAQPSGAYLVSFNDSAFTSYGKGIDATNAPTSKAAAFRYGAALNSLLERGTSRNRISIGDATVVFWADASGVGEEAARAAEATMAGWLVPAPKPEESADEDAAEAVKLRDALVLLRAGRPVEDLNLGLKSGTVFHVLGLSPNAARLSVRFWLTDDFSAFAKRLADHAADLRIEPLPFDWGSKPPGIQRLLVKTTALMEKFENIPSLLAGEVTRAVLSGERYPMSLLAAAIIRLRAGDDVSTGWHAAVIKAVLNRDLRLNHKEEIPVSLERDNPDQAYQLGRLFAAVETAQRAALGKVNATIRDRYFGAASATPASVFPILLRGVQNHLAKLRKNGKGIWLEREIEEISSHLNPELPRALKMEEQGRFAIGYYHQRRGQYANREEKAEIETMEAQEGESDE